ncbi:hypothetical protein CKO25_19515 [Thiocapsa imhoffii]|uniref:Uncharacterized protein n=1 Tax=Thiocapsa imhoffii TaxID=382777 RepID=A0A9X0WL61_9GAMM|nr:hypothetical protein [Thiocapsa imhoffii]MBK1646786.1 hypothetical protein [Thiocapsa imhoffii]
MKKIIFWIPRKIILYPVVWIAVFLLWYREHEHWTASPTSEKEILTGSVVWMQYRCLIKHLTDDPIMAELRSCGMNVVEFPKQNFSKCSLTWTLLSLPLEIDAAITRVQKLIKKTGMLSELKIDYSFILEKLIIAPKILALISFTVLEAPFIRHLAGTGTISTLITRSGGVPIGSLIRGMRKQQQEIYLTHIHIPHSSNVGDMHFSDADYFSDILCARNYSQQTDFLSLRVSSDLDTPMLGNLEGYYLAAQRAHIQREQIKIIYILVGGAYLSDRSARELQLLSNVLETCRHFGETVVKAKNADRWFALIRMVKKVGPAKAYSLYKHSKCVGIEELVRKAAIGIVVVNDKNYVSNIFDDLAYFNIPRIVYTEEEPNLLINKTPEILAHCVNAMTLQNAVRKIIAYPTGSGSIEFPEESWNEKWQEAQDISPGLRLFEIIKAREVKFRPT